MPLDVTILTNAWAHIRANPLMAVADQEAYLADALKQFVQSADINYAPATLDAPSGGGPVTGTGTSIGTLS